MEGQPGFDPLPPPPGEAEPEPGPSQREPFWGWSDLLLVAGLGVPAMGMVAAAATFGLSKVTKVKAVQLLPAQFLGYAVLFGILFFIFRSYYGGPFWESLGWRRYEAPSGRVVLLGVLTAIGVVLGAAALGTPDKANPMKELLSTRGALLLAAVFGTTIGPLCEELIFRGFLQPLLVRAMGVAAGIFAASVPFGLLHLPQYGYSWRHALLVALAGTAFGWMRHASGSTRASTLMHAAYNALFFLALLTQRKDLPQTW